MSEMKDTGRMSNIVGMRTTNISDGLGQPYQAEPGYRLPSVAQHVYHKNIGMVLTLSSLGRHFIVVSTAYYQRQPLILVPTAIDTTGKLPESYYSRNQSCFVPSGSREIFSATHFDSEYPFPTAICPSTQRSRTGPSLSGSAHKFVSFLPQTCVGNELCSTPMELMKINLGGSHITEESERSTRALRPLMFDSKERKETLKSTRQAGQRGASVVNHAASQRIGYHCELYASPSVASRCADEL